jgi:hypothetical protein
MTVSHRGALRTVVTALVAATTVAGCGGVGSLVSTPASPPAGSPASSVAPPSSTAPPAPTEADVAWVDGYCGVLVDVIEPTEHAPSFDQKRRPAFKKAAGKHLETLAAGGRLARTGRADLGSAPGPAGEKAAKQLKQVLTERHKTVTGAQKTLKKADPKKHKAFDAARKKIVKTLSGLDHPDGVAKAGKAIGKTPALARAAASAPNCREVTRLTGGAVDLAKPGH